MDRDRDGAALTRRVPAAALAGLLTLTASCRAPETSPPVDLLEETYLVFAPEGGEELTSPVAVGGETRPSLVAPMPAEYRYRIRIPERPTLTFAMGVAIAPGAAPRAAENARVRFTLKGGEGLPDALLYEREIDAAHGSRWIAASADLDRFAGQEIWLVFQAVLAGSDGVEEAPVVGVVSDPVLHDRAHYGSGRAVVVVTVDGLRRESTSLHGYERKTTPGLDALAEDSVVFREGGAAAGPVDELRRVVSGGRVLHGRRRPGGDGRGRRIPPDRRAGGGLRGGGHRPGTRAAARAG